MIFTVRCSITLHSIVWHYNGVTHSSDQGRLRAQCHSITLHSIVRHNNGVTHSSDQGRLRAQCHSISIVRHYNGVTYGSDQGRLRTQCHRCSGSEERREHQRQQESDSRTACIGQCPTSMASSIGTRNSIPTKWYTMYMYTTIS